MVLYNALIVNQLHLWKVSNITFAYHVVDYSLGFRSQLLPGAIFYGIFGERASRVTASVYETVLLLLFFAGISFFLERFLLAVEQPFKPSAYVLTVFFLSGPFTFAVFTDELGMLDVYWLFFSLLFFVVLEKKGFRFLIPALFVLSLLVHFSSVLNYLILFAILLLYRISVEKEKQMRKIYFCVFGLSVLATAGLFVFFLLFHTENLPLTQEEFHQMLQDRGSSYFLYYDYSFYNQYGGAEVVPSSVLSIPSPVLRTIQMIVEKCKITMTGYRDNLEKSVTRFIIVAVILTPIVAFIYRQWLRLYKSSKGNKLKRLCSFLMMVQFPFTAVVGCLFSPDVIRWFTHAFLISFTMFLYALYHEREMREKVLDDMEQLKDVLWVKVYFLAYFIMHVMGYS